eukprot:CAMPEP_0194287470 /NCGR_PEP_ID=MMETSP0169-20130528/34816_1 /TAXON_ID=218684 /ORGANISM="Corethron pennatum, Strain L29A3" /LENGTH=42 /DNA_ID= /DNA_START= /DNA_END= /DNA_ORIENTATION=
MEMSAPTRGGGRQFLSVGEMDPLTAFASGDYDGEPDTPAYVR